MSDDKDKFKVIKFPGLPEEKSEQTEYYEKVMWLYIRTVCLFDHIESDGVREMAKQKLKEAMTLATAVGSFDEVDEMLEESEIDFSFEIDTDEDPITE